MKIPAMICGTVLLCVLAWGWMHRYEFHTGHSGDLIYRCDHLSGSVDCAGYGGTWERMKPPVKPVKPEPIPFYGERPK